MHKSFLLVTACALLTACGSPSKSGNSDVGPYPTNWKELTREYIRESFLDPFSIRDSEASAPFRNKKAFWDHGYTVCIRNNAKNRMGGYTGRTETSIDIRNGQVVDHSREDFECRNNRASVNYEPLPLDFAKQETH